MDQGLHVHDVRNRRFDRMVNVEDISTPEAHALHRDALLRKAARCQPTYACLNSLRLAVPRVCCDVLMETWIV